VSDASGPLAADVARARDEDGLRFARALAIATRLALVAAALVFALLALEALPVRVALAEMPAHWGRDARAWQNMLADATVSWSARSPSGFCAWRRCRRWPCSRCGWRVGAIGCSRPSRRRTSRSSC
jgi:hypothetical protein